MNAASKMILAAQKRHAAYDRMMATESGSLERRIARRVWQVAKRQHVESRRACGGHKIYIESYQFKS